VQCLKTRYGVTVRIVGVQPQPEIGVGEVLGLSHGAHVEYQPVICFGDLTDEPHGCEQRILRGRHAAQECDPVLKQTGEPVRSHAAVGLHLLPARTRKVAPSLEVSSLEPAARLELRTVGAPVTLCGEPGQVEPIGLGRTFPFDMQPAVLHGGRADARLLGQIGDVDEPLTTMRVAVSRGVVVQPDARELIDTAVRPRNPERVGASEERRSLGLRIHGKCLPSRTAFELR